MSKYTQLALNAFNKIQMNAGILCRSFDTSTGAVAGIIGVTSGGIAFNAAYTFSDFGEDMDNVPKNTKELKRIESVEVKASGTFATIDADEAVLLIPAGAVNESFSGSGTEILPYMDLDDTAFNDLWIVGDYSSDVSEATGGWCAIHLLNALSTGGFQLQTTDKDKGKLAFEFTAHYSYDDPNTIPFELYIRTGTNTETITVRLAASQTASNSTSATILGRRKESGEVWRYKVQASATAPSVGSTASTSDGWSLTSNATFNIASPTVGYTVVAAIVTVSDDKIVAVGHALITNSVISGVITNVVPTQTLNDGEGGNEGDGEPEEGGR